MANPQKENGHTSIANELLEVMAKTYFSSYEIQIIFAIFRKTYGWNKTEDWITTTQISEMTDIARSHVSRTIKKLLDRNMLVKNGKKLSFQKDYEKWQKLPKQVTNKTEKKLPIQDTKLPKQVHKVTQMGTKLLPKQVHTKEKKETIQKKLYKRKGDVFIKTLNNFKTMRNKIKKPMTDKAESMLITRLEKLSPDVDTQIKIMEQSIFHCWQDVYHLKKEKIINPNQNGYDQFMEKVMNDRR
ncbi:MAG: replication protein [Candidatus Paceibacterota bacterium]|jgi:phage replication O-like protein O